MFERIMGVFRLDKKTFEAIEADTTATSQAAIIVALVGVLAAIGAAIGAAMANRILSTTLPDLQAQLGGSLPFNVPTLSPIGAFLNALVGAFVAWIVWSALTYFIGTRVFKGQSNFNEMLRMIGFAQAPRLLSVFAFIPCIGGLLSFAGWIWSLVASYIAVREGLDIDNGKTILTVVISFLVAFLVNLLILGPIFAALS